MVVAVPWPTPSPEILLRKFNPDLLTVNLHGILERSGQVSIAARELVLTAQARSQPTVHILTTEVPFTAQFEVSVLRRTSRDVFPFQLKIWNPRAEAAVEAWYDPNDAMMVGTRVSEQWLHVRRLGEYRTGSLQTWRIVRTHRQVMFEVRTEGKQESFAVDQESFPALLEQQQLSLTIYATATGRDASSTVVVSRPSISVPHQTQYGTTVQSPWFSPVIGLLALCSLLWVVLWARASPRWVNAKACIERGWLKVHRRGLLVFLAFAGASFLAGLWVARTPGHPFDIRTATVYSTIAREEGLGAIIAHSLLATEGDAHGGQPYATVSYPYPPLLTYVFWGVGKIAPAGQIEPTLKFFVMLGVMAGGAVLFVLLRRMRIGSVMAAVVAGTYVANPAILFSSAVWGQTDAFVAFFLLLGAAGAVLGSAPLLWVGTLLAALTKQTGVLFGLILITLGIARLNLRQIAYGLVVATILVFLVLTPAFLSGMHPSAIYRTTVTTALAFGTMSNIDTVNAVISQSTFTLWSTLTAFEGAHGLERFAFPIVIPSRFALSYFTLSRLTFGLFVLVLTLLVFKWRRIGPGGVFLMIAAYAVGAVVLLTRASPRYLYFGVMFTTAALPWMSRGLGIATLTVLTGTMLVSMWGMLVFTSIWYPGLLRAFDPERSWLNGAAAAVLGGDAGITLGGLLNIGALLTLLVALTIYAVRDSGSSRKQGQ